MELCIASWLRKEEELALLEEEYRRITDGTLSPNATPPTSEVCPSEPPDVVEEDHVENDVRPPPPPSEGGPTVRNVPDPPACAYALDAKGKRLRRSVTPGPVDEGGAQCKPTVDQFSRQIPLCPEAELSMYMREIQRRQEEIVDADDSVGVLNGDLESQPHTHVFWGASSA